MTEAKIEKMEAYIDAAEEELRIAQEALVAMNARIESGDKPRASDVLSVKGALRRAWREVGSAVKAI